MATVLSSSALDLPSIEELSSAPFMKQVQYGSDMTDLLRSTSDGVDDDDGNNEAIKASLAAQLSHSDGIRGFMVAYLTGSYESSTSEDGSIDAGEMMETETDPRVLLETLHGLLAKQESESGDDLVSLMCMNVVMPVAMITMHEDPALSEASKLTAARGARLLGSFVSSSASIRSNAEAILEAASVSETSNNESGDETKRLVAYWTKFFGKWGYGDAQKEDIGATMKELLSTASS
eukprot:CAMPEP_0201117098 /NCGR_PEP_ID=MMETSP0850-20130426/1176_1 /ASSEMBLY_ACC=CAM_ASM_000622 /TAXON_ID=183588 /ORGANISM="Pseudo-nitzschia fraudulenta, Strain WWA7" /LENGTH=234 /DNA_ID=CAMNT_0047381339 /DNA_START=199 /DNA_END=903 /DNA_ORIENTATION=+